MLGTYVEVSLSGELDESELLELSEAGFDEMARIEKIMSFHDETSELSMINRMAHERPVEISPEMSEVLGLGLSLSALSDGYYDLAVGACLVENELLPKTFEGDRGQSTWRDLTLTGKTVSFKKPIALDLGGIAKGYAVDRAIEVFGERVDSVVNAGGDLRMNPWIQKNAAIRVPQPDFAISLECPMQRPALATSASYFHEGMNPIFCPYSKESIMDTFSVSVFADTCMLADALTKIAFVAPLAKEIMHEMEAEAIVVDDQGSMIPFEKYARNR